MAYRRIWGCGVKGKIGYTKADAERAVREWLFMERDPKNRQGMNAYRCRDGCGRWHIGHSSTKAGRLRYWLSASRCGRCRVTQ